MAMMRLPSVLVIYILAAPLLPARGSEPSSTPVPSVDVTAASHLASGHADFICSYLDSGIIPQWDPLPS
uniref:Uncharacterized protein n=1 Tax=Oryza brachyantha TaxID=4533 RepID=J3LW72_ORYBR